jgi:hypothetical protein
MPQYPDIIIPGPNLLLWLWVIIPLGLAVLFLVSENFIERFTEKKFDKPVVGVGYILMGVSLLVGVMAFNLVPDLLQAEHTANAVKALEAEGFSEVRITMDAGTFGAIYDGELMRGVVISDPAVVDGYHVQQTFPRE